MAEELMLRGSDNQVSMVSYAVMNTNRRVEGFRY